MALLPATSPTPSRRSDGSSPTAAPQVNAPVPATAPVASHAELAMAGESAAMAKRAVKDVAPAPQAQAADEYSQLKQPQQQAPASPPLAVVQQQTISSGLII